MTEFEFDRLNHFEQNTSIEKKTIFVPILERLNESTNTQFHLGSNL